ncbi:efflux RND transporter periplasmic adaptor subunit [Vibrio sp. MarTm2]|uniref:efflux RND transporter periplasmic adaptor subunit n=1 Tax=Vibrio sp. MarTm2 TaxID=2998831 RepID=UPI0022CD90AD|nr:efflux RND transporter periplasmic adaptor subunit [Vibrio sp. MarTm2]MDA0128567.1 efflux RND transporter periplasmic adaptor subunit [Vibrio sp. MarTm2]
MKFSKLAVLTLTVATLMGCKPEVEHRSKNGMTVETFNVQAPIATQHRSFNGQVVPAELTPLAFRLEGEIIGIMVQEGDHVEKGQVIAMLDDSKHRDNLSDAQARFELALKQFKRGEELHVSKMISKAELDQLQANYKLANAHLGLAQSRISYTRLKAPFSGVVSSVIKQKHEVIQPGESVATVYRSDDVYVKVSVSDSVLAMLRPQVGSRGYKPKATFSGHEGEYEMRYLEHTSELHPESQTYEFWLTMPQVEDEILPGTGAKIAVDLMEAGLQMSQAYQLPITAIEAGEQQREFYVWKLENNKVHRHQITVDQINGKGAVVLDGIKRGDVLVNSSLRKLREGMEIKGAQL